MGNGQWASRFGDRYLGTDIRLGLGGIQVCEHAATYESFLKLSKGRLI